MSFYNLIKNQFGRTIKIMWSDNRLEFLSKELQDFFLEKGIMHQTSYTETTQ